MKILFSLLCCAFLTMSCVSSNDTKSDQHLTSLEASQQMIDRIMTTKSKRFKLEIIAADNKSDVFEIESMGKKIVLRGNNSVAIASALNYYLTHYCNCQVSMNYRQLDLPDVLPTLPEKIRTTTPFEYRYIFNYCTYGYSMPWWDWNKWEEMIDYLACMGVNMPLATIGQEAVWYEVYKELGMTDEQIDGFFVGPAHLPWGWMGNIDGMAGPLPKSWLKQRAELQTKVLDRMRSLGMKPVLQGFTGHVPKELKEIFPDADIMQIHDWAGIEGTQFLSPTDPLFSKIGTLFIQKQTEMFGTDHLYDADCFIEVDPPSNDPEFLSDVSKTVYESMVAADPEAIWVVQGWFFFFRSEFWQTEQGRAFVGGVPKDKIIVLDLYGEANTTWDKTESFFGQPWIWNVICNEDQKVNMSGDLQKMDDNFQTAFQSEIKNNLRGVGTIPEGVGFNPIIQDFIFEKAWNQTPVKAEAWVKEYAQRRYGTETPQAINAWALMQESVYGRTRTDWLPLITTPRIQLYQTPHEDMRHVRKKIRITEANPFGQDYDVMTLLSACENLLACADELSNVETYRFDLTNTHRELLVSLTYLYINNLTEAYASDDLCAFERASEELLALLDDLEKITGTNENFMLGKWIADARQWGETEMEKDYYECNARTIITIWQPLEEGGLRDYAGKQWNGMFSGYYKPRWELLIDMLRTALENNEEYSPENYDKAVRKIDYAWTHGQEKYPAQAADDVVDIARYIHKKYNPIFTSIGK